MLQNRALTPVQPIQIETVQVGPVPYYLSRFTVMNTQRAFFFALGTFCEAWVGNRDCVNAPWHQLNILNAQLTRDRLSKTRALKTANLSLVAVRGLVDTMLDLDMLDLQTADRLKKALRCIPGKTPETGRALSLKEQDILLNVCTHDHDRLKGLRDAAAIAIMLSGLRQDEMRSLDLADFDPTQDLLNVKIAKGSKPRTVPMRPQSARYVKAYLEIRGDRAGKLIEPHHAGFDWKPGKKLGSETVRRFVAQRAKEAGLGPLTPHDLRRSTVTTLLDQNVDVLLVSRVVGHSDPATTKRYDRRPERAMIDAIRKSGDVQYHEMPV